MANATPLKCTKVKWGIEEDPAMANVVVETMTSNGTRVAILHRHCTWTFEDANGHARVGLSCVLPSSVGLTTAQLDPWVHDMGNVL
jgi:hypothetical protein